MVNIKIYTSFEDYGVKAMSWNWFLAVLGKLLTVGFLKKYFREEPRIHWFYPIRNISVSLASTMQHQFIE